MLITTIINFCGAGDKGFPLYGNPRGVNIKTPTAIKNIPNKKLITLSAFFTRITIGIYNKFIINTFIENETVVFLNNYREAKKKTKKN